MPGSNVDRVSPGVDVVECESLAPAATAAARCTEHARRQARPDSSRSSDHGRRGSGPPAPLGAEGARRARTTPGQYGFVDGSTTDGINGGVGGGEGYEGKVLFYVGVPHVAAALEKAASLGGKRRMGPVKAPAGDFVVAQFIDPDGNLIGIAGSE